MDLPTQLLLVVYYHCSLNQQKCKYFLFVHSNQQKSENKTVLVIGAMRETTFPH